MYLDNLDELDQKIIQLLIENARISYSDIGEETGISRVAVKARIQAMEKKGIIEEYTTIINPQKSVGLYPVILKFEIKPRAFGTGDGYFIQRRYSHTDLPCHRKRQIACTCCCFIK